LNSSENPIKNERDIVERCKTGDMKAFREIYESRKVMMYNIALRICKNKQDAEDCIQEAFVKIYKNISSFNFDSALSTWIYRIVVNTCLTYLKKNRKNEEVKYNFPEEIEDKNSSDSDSQLKSAIEREISNLPDGYRTVFVLYEVEGFSHEEISKILKISVGTSKSQLSRAKELLRERLKDYRE
jgi:RNA polymerase sigma-70 factor (ECF subfamily)